MNSLLLNQSLEIYGQSLVAICRLHSLATEAITFLKKGWSGVVVLDQQDHPQGLFSAKCLLSLYDGLEQQSDRPSFLTTTLTLEDVDLEPLPAIASTMTVADFLTRITQYRHSAETWALVDSNGKFGGVLEVSSLLRSLVAVDQEQSPTINSLLLPLIYQLPLPVMVSDRQGSIVGMNAAWRNSLHDGSIFQGESLAEGDRQGQALLPPTQPVTHQFCTTDGESLTWQVISVALQGSLQGLDLAIAYDITAQKNLAQELSGLSRVKDEFLTCINHELKTPLTSVIGISSLLSNNTFGNLNERQSRYVKMIHQSGRQLVAIIDNIFDLAKAESGQLELYPETISINDVCQKSIQQVRKLIHQDTAIHRNYNFDEGWQLNIQLDIDPTIKTIWADEMRLQQMLVHLLSNAFKFSFLPSELVDDIPLGSPKIGIKVRWWEGWLAITVWDQGIGIPEEKQSLVFQKFQQIENVLTRQFEGTGSSLLLTRHLARLHGGDITFVSQVDVGSQFTILLPTENNSPLVSAQYNLSNAKQNRIVLVVETSIEVVDWLRNALVDLDYQVIVARSGTEALEKARRLQPCLILLSPDVPMLSGWDVLALLKGDHLTQHIRVIMMRHIDEPKVVVHKADGFLLKPITRKDLSAVLPNSTVAKSLKLVYLQQNLSETIVELLQDLGHCLLESEDLSQCDVLLRIWLPDLFLLSGDSQLLLSQLEQINQLDIFMGLPILIITSSEIAEIEWLKARFQRLNLHECAGVYWDSLENRRSNILLNLYQAINDALV
ncbi:MAG: hybrid sensor histidine kinase/response regulator [Pseudanabaenaceae cyanobacterium bins.39]|nr:hybrid sensor histidine kinase/response regulator [Pseudanabaenaceae cyanobacterium bins.39]